MLFFFRFLWAYTHFVTIVVSKLFFKILIFKLELIYYFLELHILAQKILHLWSELIIFILELKCQDWWALLICLNYSSF